MERLRVTLDASNSRRYRARPVVKHAVIKKTGSEYSLSSGIQRFDGPHVEVLDESGHYGVSLARFFDTHQALPDRVDHYVKVAKVRAWCADRPCELTTVVDGKDEITARVAIGDYVVQNPKGEQYVVAAAKFAERYILDE